MVQYLHLEERKKKRRWPDLAFSEQGPRLTIKDLDAYPIVLTAEHCDFLLRTNGGVPAQPYYRREDDESTEQIECVDYFYGAKKTGSKGPVRDIADAILEYRDHLPRWSIPLGRVDDDSFLLTFWNGEHEGKVWLFLWLHDDDHDEADPNDGDGLYLLANSIAEFLSLLRNAKDFWAVEAFAIDEERLPLKQVAARLKKLGCDHQGQCGTRQAPCEAWSWDRFEEQTSIETELFLVHNGKVPSLPVADLELPALAAYANGHPVLYVKVSQSYRDQCVKAFQKALGAGAELVDRQPAKKRNK
jgi:hypothetical protein